MRYNILYETSKQGGFITNSEIETDTQKKPLLSKKTKATLLLIAMAAGAVFTYDHGDSFGWNLFHHGFLAAVIGGLADWFAITALFRKPLGFITFRSEVLPRSRERIMDELVQFISRDLLSPAYIISNIKNYSFAQMFLEYCEADGGRGRRRVKAAFGELTQEIISSLDTPKIGHSLAQAFKGRRDNFNMARILIQFLRAFIKTENGDKFLDCMIKSLRDIAPQLVNDDFAKKLLSDNVEIIKKRYTKDKQMRELMFDIVDLSGDNLRSKLLTHINNWSEKLLAHESPERARFKEFVSNKIELLGRRDGYKRKVLQLEHYFFVKKFDFSDNLTALIEHFCSSERNRADLLAEVNRLLDDMIDDLAVNKDKQAKMDDYLTKKLSAAIEDNFPKAVDYIRDRLMRYSTEEFVELIESRVGNDLQMIRINGSVIGGLAGMGLYLISFVVERLCSLL